jgi:putative membrane protein
MMWVARWIVCALALVAVAKVVGALLGPESLSVEMGREGFLGALLFVAILSMLNSLVLPLARLLTLPLNCATFGLFGVLLNGAAFLIAARFVNGVKVGGFVAGVVGSVVYSIVTSVALSFLSRIEKARRASE